LGLHYATEDLWPQTGGKEIKTQPSVQGAGPPSEATIQDLATKLDTSKRPVIMVVRGIAGKLFFSFGQ